MVRLRKWKKLLCEWTVDVSWEYCSMRFVTQKFTGENDIVDLLVVISTSG